MAVRPPSKSSTDRLYGHGAKVGKYKIKRYLGGGGFGETYEAGGALGTVALKFVKDGEAVDEAQRLRDVNRQAKIKVVPEVHHVVEDHKHPYIVMEYVDGKTLEKFFLAEGPLHVRVWWLTLRPLLMGLDAIHSKSLNHRDIKPANIILRGGNPTQPVFIDLGASRYTTDSDPTQIGTPEYVHPDFAGRGAEDARRDIAALAAVSYDAIYGYGQLDTWHTMRNTMQSSQQPLEQAIALGFGSLEDIPTSVSMWLARMVESVLSTDGDTPSPVPSPPSSTSNLDVASSVQLDVQTALEILERRYVLPAGCLALMHNTTDRVPDSQNLYAYRQTQQEMPQTVADSESISGLTGYLRAELGLIDDNKKVIKCVRPDGRPYNGKTHVGTMRKEYEDQTSGTGVW